MRNPRNAAPMNLLDIIKHGYFQQVRFLVEHGVDLDMKDTERRTALMMCAFIEPEAWGVGICRLLIENGATLYFRDKYGLNAFHYAVIYDRVELLRVYLKAIDFNLNESDKLGNTALHYAVRSGNPVIVKLIAQACLKYQLTLDKPNNDGFTPLQEARRLNKRKCVRVLEEINILSDESNIEPSELQLNLNGIDSECDTMSIRSSRKSITRPRSSIISLRSSKTSLVSNSDTIIRRHPSLYSNEDRPMRRRRLRDKPEYIPPHVKNEKQIIRCASASDVRNNPEVLFHMTPFDPSFAADVRPSTTKPRAKSAFVRRSELENGHGDSWRTEFRKLYMHYQFQCTPSYRESVISELSETASLPPLDKSVTPATSEHAIDEMDKRSKSRAKSGSISRQNTDESLSAGKSRQQSKQARKMSQNIGHGGKMGSVDGSLESSSESINSSVSSKRQADGKVTSKPPKPDAAGRQSRTTNHRASIPSVNVEEAHGSRAPSVDNGSVDPRLLNVINE